MATDELIWRKDEMVRCLWYEYEFDDYEGFSNRFVDNIKFCIANSMGTFLQSDMSLFRLIPFRSKNTLSFWLKSKKFGTKLVIFWNRIAREELKAGQSKAKCKIFSTLFWLQFIHLSVIESPVTKRCEFRNDLPTRKWAKNLFPIFVPYLKWQCLTGL